jgi:hypothetical protein
MDDHWGRFVGTPKRGTSIVKHHQRRTFVFACLVAFMSATGAILLALSPQPLAPDLPQRLLAIDAPVDPMEAVFTASAEARPNAWRYIYIRHTKSAAGSAEGLLSSGEPLGDHFLIGNGAGAGDGEIQITPRWTAQRSALPPTGATSIDPQCISISLVGDFDRNPPTPQQMRRLTRLVCALQARLNIPASNVVAPQHGGTAAAAGKRFPVAEFRSQILP